MSAEPTPLEREKRLDIIRRVVAEDLASGKHAAPVTRFPPEPNGFLHIGHAKSICLNFGIAEEFGGRCHLRFDDTNPAKEEELYVEAIKEDVRWLGFDWGEHLHHASDYFEQIYAWAEHLVENGDAYVDDQNAEEIRAGRGTLTAPGINSPYRDRPAAESLDLLRRMKAGEFPDGARVLRAKIDMASPNLNLRDPVLYRIMHRAHQRTGDAWCLYPMYDFAHGQSDAIEGITHSVCTVEFENHRPLYDWLLAHLPVPHTPHQYEFARLNLTYTLMSKRKLLKLVEDGVVEGWDDPRMPTLAGLRRRGVTPEAIRAFCDTIGVSKTDSTVDLTLFEHHVRQDLETRCPRFFGVLDPLKLTITNWPEGEIDELEVPNHPSDESFGKRTLPFGREIWVERDDFREEPPRKWRRLTPGKEVRLRYAYYVTCQEVVKDAAGNVVELRCTYDPESRGGGTADERKVRGTLHWVPVHAAVDAEVRLYEPLFQSPDPEDVEEGKTFLDDLNPQSLQLRTEAKLEPSLAAVGPDDRVQFERLGYFRLDAALSKPGKPVWLRTIALRDSWAKIEKKQQGG